jgi:UDP-N-acetylmuramate--alanine ligase
VVVEQLQQDGSGDISPGSGSRQPTCAGDVRSYGEGVDAAVRLSKLEVQGGGSSFDVVVRVAGSAGSTCGSRGAHNALDATAAFYAGLGFGFDSPGLREGFAG